MKKLAAVYEREGQLFVLASHKTKAGSWIDDDQVTCLRQPTHDELGRAIEQALERSRDGAPTPRPGAGIDKPLLKAVRVGSLPTFTSLPQHVSIVSDGSLLKVTSYRNSEGKEGFEPAPDIRVPSANPASALGQIVADLLGRTV